MGYRNALEGYLSGSTPQRAKARHDQVLNRAGGYVFEVDLATRLRRFLVLGAFGTYYADAREMEASNIADMVAAMRDLGTDAVDMIEDMSYRGLAPKNDPAIFALMAAMSPDERIGVPLEVRKAAAAAFPSVVRIGTHLFKAAHYLEGFRGWGRMARRVFSNWYLSKSTATLAYQMVKYQARTADESEKGSRWSHRDILRLAHPKTDDPARNAIFHWSVRSELPANAPSSDPGVHLIQVYEAAKRATSESDIIGLIREHGLTWEFVPSNWLGSREVWEELLPNLPYTALMRNLARLTSLGIIVPGSRAEDYVASRLTDLEAIKRQRVHPFSIYLAYSTYKGGAGRRGRLSWNASNRVLGALAQAFYDAFETVEPTGKRFLVGVDVSGSMFGSRAVGSDVSCAEAAGAISTIFKNVEQDVHLMAFCHEFKPLLKEADMAALHVVHARMQELSMEMGATDCSIPMLYAMKHNIMVDTFVVITDSETWYGQVHPFEALRKYREAVNPDARLVVLAMTGTHYSIADPNDPGMLDVVGLDASVPTLVANFAKGEF